MIFTSFYTSFLNVYLAFTVLDRFEEVHKKMCKSKAHTEKPESSLATLANARGPVLAPRLRCRGPLAAVWAEIFAADADQEAEASTCGGLAKSGAKRFKMNLK